MRKLLSYRFPFAIPLVALGFLFVPVIAHAFVDGALSLLTGGTDIFYGLIGKIFWWVLIPFTNWLLGLIGYIIDIATTLSLTSAFYTSEAISAAWMIIRDLCNMLFIFVLIYTGISTILNVGNATIIKKMIINVIIAALLINFSLFITKLVIDVSNVATSWFVLGVQNIGGDGTSISYSVKSVLEMDKLTENKQFGEGAFTLASFVTGIALFVLNCIAIYVFFKVAFFLVARIVTFFFLLVTSPLGFLGSLGVPHLSGYAEKWWKELRNQALMAPMFFLMLYITLYITERVDTLVFATSAGRIDTVTGSSFAPANYVMFAIIIVMLLKSLSVAEEYSGELGGKVTEYLKSATGFATGALAFGTIGRAANALKGNKGFQRWASESAVGDMLHKGTTYVSNSGFGVKSNYGALAKSTGLPKDAFKGADNYGKQRKAEAEARKKDLERLGKGPEGAANRIAYLERQVNNPYNKLTGAEFTIPFTKTKISLTGSKAAAKEELKEMRKKSKEEITKGVKEDAKNKASNKQNQVVAAQTVENILKKPLNSADPKEVEKAANLGSTLIHELKQELEDENKDDYLKFVRGLDDHATLTEQENVKASVKLSEEIETLHDQAQHLIDADPVANKDEIARIEAKITATTGERSKIDQKTQDDRAAFAALAKNVTAKDRKEAAEKFSPLSKEEWEKAKKKQIEYTNQIEQIIENAEKALEAAVKGDADLLTKKAKLVEAQRAVSKLIGSGPIETKIIYKDGKPLAELDENGNPKMGNDGQPIYQRYSGKKKGIIPGTGTGLKKQAGELKQKSKEMNDELKIGDKDDEEEEEAKGEKEGEKDKPTK